MNWKYHASGALVVLAAVLAVVAGRNLISVAETPGLAGQLNAKGPADAPIEIVEYSDFQCPACATAQAALRRFLETYPGKVRIVFRHFPLAGHTWAPLAHQAAECASRQGRFWEYHDRLFQEQAVWSGPENPLQRFLTYARDLNLDLDGFALCLNDETVREKIASEKKEGLDRQVRSTPTFFVNGEMVTGSTELNRRGEAVIRSTLNLPDGASAGA